VTGNFEPTFIQLRRGALEKFLQRIAAHPVLRTSEDLQIFLEANDETLQAAKATVSHAVTQAGGKKEKGFFQWAKETAQGMSNAVGKLPEEFNDPAYEEQKLKIEELKNQVTNLQRYTMRLVYRMRELSVIKTELGDIHTNRTLSSQKSTRSTADSHIPCFRRGLQHLRRY